MRKYDTLAISLLMLSGIVSTALVIDPKGFSLQAWQPFLAALVALGAASMAYRASMAKVELDRWTAEEGERKKAIKFCLRLQFALVVLRSEASTFANWFDPAKHRPGELTRRDAITFSTEDGLSEAWDNFEIFETAIALDFNRLRTRIYNAAIFRDDLPAKFELDVNDAGMVAAKLMYERIAELADSLRISVTEMRRGLTR